MSTVTTTRTREELLKFIEAILLQMTDEQLAVAEGIVNAAAETARRRTQAAEAGEKTN